MHARVDRAKTAAARPQPRARSLRARLLLLAISLLLPALAAAAFLIWDSSRQALRFQERQLVATARTLSLVVDRQLSEQTGLLNALSASYRLESGDWPAFDDQARRALAGSVSWVVVRDEAGHQLVNTLLPPDAHLPTVSNPRVPANHPPRADRIRISELANGAVAGEPVFIVVKAVRLKDGGQVDLSIVTRASTFGGLLQRQRLPASWTATVLDGDHRVIARSRDDHRFRGQTVTPLIGRFLTPGAAGLIWGRSLDGIATRTAFEPVAGSDWAVVVGVPARELQAPARRALILGTLVAIVLLLGGVTAAAHAAGQITTGVRRLQAAAAGGVGEEFVRPQASHIAEIDELADAFERAASRMGEHAAMQQLLINELNHRVKNTLATLQSVASHSRHSAGSVDQFHTALEGRIMAMSSAHELLTRASWSSADLGELARLALKPFTGPRVTISGPPVEVGPTDVLNLTLIFYELATNAAKYGALSSDAGSVSLTWSRDGDAVRIDWLESGGPAVEQQGRRGFGSRLIQKARETLQPSEFDFHPAGVRCRLTLRVKAD